MFNNLWHSQFWRTAVSYWRKIFEAWQIVVPKNCRWQQISWTPMWQKPLSVKFVTYAGRDGEQRSRVTVCEKVVRSRFIAWYFSFEFTHHARKCSHRFRKALRNASTCGIIFARRPSKINCMGHGRHIAPPLQMPPFYSWNGEWNVFVKTVTFEISCYKWCLSTISAITKHVADKHYTVGIIYSANCTCAFHVQYKL